MAELNLSPRDRLRCLIALIGALSVVSTLSSLMWPILSEALRNRGWDETMIGVNAAAQFGGIVVVALLVTRIIPWLGFYRTILTGLAVAALMLLLLPLLRDYWAWFVLRFLMGMGLSLLFTAGDTWVNLIVEDRVRGRWLGIYSTVGMAGWAVGPIMGSMMDPESWWPFVAGLIAVAIATVVLLPTRHIDIRLSSQADHDPGRGKLLAVLIIAPTVLLSAAMFGIVEGSVQSFAHLYTMDLLGEQFRAVGYAVIWVASVGAIFFQFPVGWLADKMDRGWLLVICVAVLFVMVSLLPVLIVFGADPWWTPGALALWASLSLWGGAMGAIFTVGITLLGQRFKGVELVAANAVFSVLFGVGGLVGPFIVGAAMEHFGSRGYPAALAFTVLAYLLFAAYRQFIRTGWRRRA